MPRLTGMRIIAYVAVGPGFKWAAADEHYKCSSSSPGASIIASACQVSGSLPWR